MAHATAKTPAMVLQELTVKRNCAPPEFVLVMSRCGRHDNEFHYQVNVAGVSARGFGRSKQVAKHDAATKALELLAGQGVYDPQSEPMHEFNAQSHRNESDNPLEPPVNHIGSLKDVCAEHKLPYPIFIEISDVGPPHCRVFTYECRMGSLITQSTAMTKKQAKQLAARDMMDKVKDMCPRFAEQMIDTANALTDKDMEVVGKAEELMGNLDVILNRSVPIEEFPYTIRNIMEEKGLDFGDFKDHFASRTRESLQAIMDALEIRFEFYILNEKPWVVAVILEIETPFTVIEDGSDRENAELNAVHQTFEVLDSYMNMTKTKIP